MRRAGFRYIFLGIENVIEEDLAFLNARSKNSRHKSGRRTNTAVEAVEALHRRGMLVVGGLIVGNPDDRRESIATNLEFARRYVDWPYIQHPTPYPGTPMTADFDRRNLIVSRSAASALPVICTVSVPPIQLPSGSLTVAVASIGWPA